MGRLRLTPLRVVLALALVTLGGLGVAHAAGIGVTSTHLYAQNQSVTHVACNQTATSAHDTYVDQASAGTNFGTQTTLLVNNRNGSQQVTFVRFDLSGCAIPTTGGADSAVLSLHVTATTKTGHTISVFPVYSSWSDSTLTWNDVAGLTIGSTATGTFANSTGAKTVTVTADVDAAIKAGNLWGWELVDTAGSGNAQTTIAAAENGTAAARPAMTLTYEK